MATATAQRRDVKEYTFVWEGFDRNNRQVRGETRAASETVVTTNLRRQGIRVTRVKRQSFRGGRRVGEKDVTFFTRQLATMLRAGVPLLQAFDIVARGHSNARFSRLMIDIKGRIEAGSSLSQAFREHPVQFDALYCNLVSAGETSGTLDAILDRLATYKEKILAIKGKIKAALFYPISVIVVAIVVVWVIMVWVIPAFKQVFTSFGADLPAPTLIVMGISDFFVTWWWLMVIVVGSAIFSFFVLMRRSTAFRYTIDRLGLKIPIIGNILEKATIARWTRTLSTMFAAGVPLVESLDAVAGDGVADDADRRGVRVAGRYAVEDRRILRARGRRLRGCALEPARADHHRVPGCGDRRPRRRDVLADLQARHGRLTVPARAALRPGFRPRPASRPRVVRSGDRFPVLPR
jgi:type IV pilus assembly protein PilC